MSVKKTPARFALFAFFICLLTAGFCCVSMATGSALREFTIRSFSPQGQVKGDVEIRVVFSGESAQAQAPGKVIDPQALPISIVPALAGEGFWESPSVFVYRPRGGRVAPATSYQVAFAPLTDRDGRLLAGPQSFAFHSAPLAFLGAAQKNYDPNERTVTFDLSFSLPVSFQKLKGFVSFTTPQGEELPYGVYRGPASKNVAAVVRYSGKGDIVLKVAKGLTSESGPLGLEKEVRVALAPKLTMEVLDSEAISDFNEGRITVRTSSPIDAKKAASFVRVSPEQKFRLEPTHDGFVVVGAFAPRSRVTLTLQKGLPAAAANGEALRADWKRAFVFPDKASAIRFAVSGRVLSPAASRTVLPIEMVNLEEVRVYAWKLYENNIPLGMRSQWQDFPLDLSRQVAEKTYKTRSGPNESIRRGLDLAELLKEHNRGVFLIRASSTSGAWAEASTVVNLTDIGITAKVESYGALVWINALHTGKPMKGVRVTLWSYANQLVGEGVTNEEGIFSLKRDTEWGGDEQPQMVMASLGDDTAFLRLDQNLWDSAGVDLSGRPYSGNGYEAFCFTPRAVFRPGETVPIHIVLRDKDRLPPKPFPVVVKVMTAEGREWKRTSAMLSAQGTAKVETALSTASPTGEWFASVQLPGQEEKTLGGVSFYVEDFVAPRVEISLQADKSRLSRKDESATVRIAARTFFGTEGANLRYELEMTPRPRVFTHPDWRAFSFGDAQKDFNPETLPVADGTLDAQGSASVVARLRPWDPPSVADLTFRAGVMEEGGRWVYQTLSIPYFPTDTLLGIESPSEPPVPNQPTPYRIAVVTPDGKAASDRALELSVLKIVRSAVFYQQDDAIRQQSQEETVLVDKQTVKSQKGIANATVVFKEGGEYVVRVEDAATGAAASVRSGVYAPFGDSGGGGALFERVQIQLDKPSYLAGETAKAQITAPFAGRLLFTVETDRICYTETRALDGNRAEVAFKVTPEMKPNAWISAWIVRPVDGATPWGSHRALGAVSMKMNENSHRLNVALEAPQRIEPASVNRFTVTTTDSAGKGASSEVAVMLVDESVLGLTQFKTPDPWEFFTSERSLGTSAYDLYSSLIPIETEKTALLRPGGGAGEAFDMALKQARLSPVQAQRFKVLSLLKTVRTDASGKADFTFTLPEFAGSARLMAVAVDKDLFGAAAKTLPVNRDVVVEPSLPRAIAPGDKIVAGVAIYNKTKNRINGTLSIVVSGPLTLRSEAKRAFSLKSENESVSIPLDFEAASASGVAKVTYTAAWGGEQFSQTIELAVRPPFPRVTASASGVLEPGKSEAITLSGGWLDGTYEGVLLLSAMPRIRLLDVTRFLVAYPHGCLEQTVSSAWALLLQPDLVRQVDEELATPYQLTAALNAKLRRVQSLQRYDGTFARWAGTYDPDGWGSVYATHLLQTARQKGTPVPAEILNAAVGALRELIARPPIDSRTMSESSASQEVELRNALALRAYACYVLTLRGEAPLGWMESLRDQMDSLPASGRFFLAAAYARSSQHDVARKLLGGKAPALTSAGAKKEPANPNYDSDLRDRALALLAWFHVDPQGPEAAQAAAELLSSLGRQSRLTTQEAGFVCLSLANYFQVNRPEGTPSARVVDEAGSALLSLTAKSKEGQERLKLTRSGQKLSLRNEGSARVFWAWSAGGVPTEPPKKEDLGMEVRRQLAIDSKEAKALDLGKPIPQGSRLVETIRIRPRAGNLEQVVVSAVLPAGLEIENPRLVGTEEADDGQMGDVRAEMRDDRLILYIANLTKPLEYRYTLRAVTRGTFAFPPIFAECMYDPGVRSLWGGGTIRIE